jgi:hypothetical protein
MLYKDLRFIVWEVRLSIIGIDLGIVSLRWLDGNAAGLSESDLNWRILLIPGSAAGVLDLLQRYQEYTSLKIISRYAILHSSDITVIFICTNKDHSNIANLDVDSGISSSFLLHFSLIFLAFSFDFPWDLFKSFEFCIATLLQWFLLILHRNSGLSPVFWKNWIFHSLRFHGILREV